VTLGATRPTACASVMLTSSSFAAAARGVRPSRRPTNRAASATPRKLSLGSNASKRHQYSSSGGSHGSGGGARGSVAPASLNPHACLRSRRLTFRSPHQQAYLSLAVLSAVSPGHHHQTLSPKPALAQPLSAASLARAPRRGGLHVGNGRTLRSTSVARFGFAGIAAPLIAPTDHWGIWAAILCASSFGLWVGTTSTRAKRPFGYISIHLYRGFGNAARVP